MTRRPWRRFSDAEDAELRALAASGLAVRSISEKLRRSRTSVKTRAGKLSIAIAARPHSKPSKWTDWECLFLDDCSSKWGWSIFSAAAMLGRPPKTVKAKAFARGVSFLNRNPYRVTFALSRSLVRDLQELATAYDMSVPGFCRVCVQTVITEQLAGAVLGFGPREKG